MVENTSISRKDCKLPKRDAWFSNTKVSPTTDDLTHFEEDLDIMIKNIEFKSVSNNFQRQLADDIKAIKNSDKVFVSTDKLRNIYLMDKDQYKKLLHENITKGYRKTNKNFKNKTNEDASKIIKPLSIDERLRKYKNQQHFLR